MLELSHDGCLLEELHFIHIFRASFQSLQGNLQISLALPYTLLNVTELTRSKMAFYSDLQLTRQSMYRHLQSCMQVWCPHSLLYCLMPTLFGDEICLSLHTTEAGNKSHSRQRLVQSRRPSCHKCPPACSKITHFVYIWH